MSTGRMIQCGKTCDLPPGFGLSDAMATSVLSTDDCAHRLALLSPSAQPQSSDRVESRCTDIGRSSFDRTVRSELKGSTCRHAPAVGSCSIYVSLFS